MVPSLRTPGRIAAELGVPVSRVEYILRTRSYISPAARAGAVRVFDRKAVAQIRQELETMAGRRNGQGGG